MQFSIEALVNCIQEADTGGRMLITIDGPCASGKTTLAEQLKKRLSQTSARPDSLSDESLWDCPMVLHTDDFVVPHARKTPERLAVPGGNCDWERLTQEVLLPWKFGDAEPSWKTGDIEPSQESGDAKPARKQGGAESTRRQKDAEPAQEQESFEQKAGAVYWQRYDCHLDCMVPVEEPLTARRVILEGSYSNLPPIRALADVRIFLDAPKELRMERLRSRENPASLQRYQDRWIPLEEAYFAAYHLPGLAEDDRNTKHLPGLGEENCDAAHLPGLGEDNCDARHLPGAVELIYVSF